MKKNKKLSFSRHFLDEKCFSSYLGQKDALFLIRLLEKDFLLYSSAFEILYLLNELNQVKVNQTLM